MQRNPKRVGTQRATLAAAEGVVADQHWEFFRHFAIAQEISKRDKCLIDK